ncbi:MAG: hypothetical protein JXX29_04880 [Deltaproteobacteria bacterium]|nr:hypothetical protein [Deltaproteobacteria bacterium]MBN2670981.1 hypothetical protein [Deltaproteobacteria bacterium]
MRANIYIGASFLCGIIALGCETGGCYYTCCRAEDDCSASCTQNVNSAEECTVHAQRECSEEQDGYIIRVEWATVSEVFCESCSSSACAPNWWTADKNIEAGEQTTDLQDTETTSDIEEESSDNVNIPEASAAETSSEDATGTSTENTKEQETLSSDSDPSVDPTTNAATETSNDSIQNIESDN